MGNSISKYNENSDYLSYGDGGGITLSTKPNTYTWDILNNKKSGSDAVQDILTNYDKESILLAANILQKHC